MPDPKVDPKAPVKKDVIVKAEVPPEDSDVEPTPPTPGGAYIVGGRFSKKGQKHYGGILQNAEGQTLQAFKDDEENPGKDWAPPANWKSPKEWTKPEGWDEFFEQRAADKK